MYAVRTIAVWLLISLSVFLPTIVQAEGDQVSPAGVAAPAGSANQRAMNKFYAVTIMTSFSPYSTKKLAKEFPDYVVYQKKSVVFGKELYLVRIGFFSNFAAATIMKERLVERFPGAWPTEVSEAEQATALGIGVVAPSSPVQEAAVAPKKAVPAGKAAGSGIYAIDLDSARIREKLVRLPMPAELNAYRTYVVSERTRAKTLYRYRLGFFPTRSDAEQARSFLTRTYPGSTIVEVTREEQVRAATPDADTSIAGAKGQAPTAPPGAVTATAEIENEAGVLLSQGRDNITSGNYIPAIKALNRLLTLPHNKFTNDAIEYIGVARERGGQFELAREMYQTYLNINPEGEGAERVRQRLASMAGAKAQPAPALRPAQDKTAPIKTISGSLSQTYYHGAAIAAVTATTPAQADLNTITQNSLISYLDLTARYQDDNYDNRVVLRDQYTYSWLDTLPKDNRLTAAYLELKDRKRDYSARFGRQPGNTGGVLGMFDGASATYNITPVWHITGNTGVPKETKVDARRYFYSVGTDFGPLAQHWYGGFYYMYQFVEGVEDRNAVGAEMRYFEPRRSVYTLVDYDLGFSVLNIAVLQANWQTESNTSYNLLLDHRKSPALQTTNVLNGAAVPVDPADPTGPTRVPNYSELSRNFTYEQLREMAETHTPESNYFDFSVSHPISPKLQLGGGVNMYNFSESPATAVAVAVPATGNTFVYSLRAIGTGLVFAKDISVLTLSHTNGETLDGNGVSLTNKSIFQTKWTFDLGLRLTKQTTTFPGVMPVENTVAVPMVKFGYRLKQTAVFEAEYGQERTHSKDTGTGIETVSRSNYYSVNYRWTF